MTVVPARPPRSWETQTLALMAAIGVAALLGMIILVSDLAIRSYLSSGGADGLSPFVSGVVGHSEAIDVLYLLLVLVYIGGFHWWRRRTATMLRTVGNTTGEPLQHWAILAWNVAIAAAFVIRLSNDRQAGDLPHTLAVDAMQTGVRLAGLTILLLGVLAIRDQVRRAVAEAGVTLRIADVAPRRAAVPSGVLRPATPAPVTAGLPAADDAFWQRVAGLGAGVAVLETTDGVARRWLLVPASGDLTEVRSGLAPGAVVTVFPAPPAVAETGGFTPPAAEEYYGFLEDGASGALWYQTVTPNRVAAFLARARNARRWALYPANADDALTAVTP
jgi:hypothetical protein